MEDNKLTAISNISELCQLRDMYLVDWPKNCAGYDCLNNFIRWLQRIPSIENIKIYTLNGNWESSGLYLAVDRYQLFVSSLLGSDDPNLLTALSILDWTTGLKVSSLPERYYGAVNSIIEDKHLEKEYDSLTWMLYMPREQALLLDTNCPQGFKSRDLCEEDADTINSIWPNKHRGSLFFIKRAIALNANAGVYKGDTNELVAWSIRLQGGFLGALQVKDNYKRLGLGSCVTRLISKKITQMGDDVTACINDKNEPSLRMFEQLGFRKIDNCYWISTNPTQPNLEWPEDK